MSALDPREVADVLFTHAMRLSPIDPSQWLCLSAHCPWSAPREGTWNTGQMDVLARDSHSHHLTRALADDGLITLMDPAELAELEAAG